MGENDEKGYKIMFATSAVDFYNTIICSCDD